MTTDYKGCIRSGKFYLSLYCAYNFRIIPLNPKEATMNLLGLIHSTAAENDYGAYCHSLPRGTLIAPVNLYAEKSSVQYYACIVLYGSIKSLTLV